MRHPEKSTEEISQEQAQALTLAQSTAAAMLERDHACRGLGIEIAEVTPGGAVMRMKVAPQMLNGHDLCHGGFIFALADTAFAYACNSYNLSTVASGAEIDFVAPARGGETLTARARERALQGRTGIYDIEVSGEDGRLIALFRGRSYRIKGNVIMET